MFFFNGSLLTVPAKFETVFPWWIYYFDFLLASIDQWGNV